MSTDTPRPPTVLGHLEAAHQREAALRAERDVLQQQVDTMIRKVRGIVQARHAAERERLQLEWALRLFVTDYEEALDVDHRLSFLHSYRHACQFVGTTDIFTYEKVLKGTYPPIKDAPADE